MLITLDTNSVRPTGGEHACCTLQAVKELDHREVAASAMKTAFSGLVSQQHAEHSFDFVPSNRTGSPLIGLNGTAPLARGPAV